MLLQLLGVCEHYWNVSTRVRGRFELSIQFVACCAGVCDHCSEGPGTMPCVDYMWASSMTMTRVDCMDPMLPVPSTGNAFSLPDISRHFPHIFPTSVVSTSNVTQHQLATQWLQYEVPDHSHRPLDRYKLLHHTIHGMSARSQLAFRRLAALVVAGATKRRSLCAGRRQLRVRGGQRLASERLCSLFQGSHPNQDRR